MTTPMRNVPGAFMHTPAIASRYASQADPVRRRLFTQQTGGGSGGAVGGGGGGGPDPHGFNSASGSGQQQIDPVTGLPVSTPKAPLARAAGYINNALNRDEQYPEMDGYCRHISSDYEVPDSNSAWAPFQRTNTYNIPQAVFDQYNRAQMHTLMGLFAPLHHAWVAIDNCLYLWDYTHPNPELIGFEDNDYHIETVKLVTPKPGVFVKEINYILVVATTAEMFLLGVAAQTEPSGAKTVTLYQTRMSLPLRGTHVRVIAGAKNGRIFFGGGDGDNDIYELYYQQEEKWFSSRTGKINHTYGGWSSVMPVSMAWNKAKEEVIDIVIDDTRNLLYSLSNMSTIRVYHMEAPDKLTKLIERPRAEILRDILHALSEPTLLLNEGMNIVSICPITATEDSRLHLMAVTDTGCRLYLNAASGLSFSQSNHVPQSMQLQSIKFPPTDQPGGQSIRRDPYGASMPNIDTRSRSLSTIRGGVRFAPGYFLAFVNKEDAGRNDLLFAATPDTGRIKNLSQVQGLRYYEQANWLNLNGRAEDIGLITEPFAATEKPLGFGNELAVQFDKPTAEIAVLTNTGVHVIRRKRLVDIFAAAIRNAVGDEGLKAEFSRFQNTYGRVEAITAALAVACGQGIERNGAGRAAIDQVIEDKARQAFVTFGGTPTMPDYDGHVAPTIDMVKPSTRHSALSLYMSRLVRSLWKSPVITLGKDGDGALRITSTIPTAKLNTVQESLERLRTFLDANKSFIQGLSGPADLQRAGNKQEELAFQGEHQALHALLVLMSGISEGISFVLMLFDERVLDIYNRLDDGTKQQLKALTFECLFSQSAGKDLAKHLVKAIVNRNIENGSNVETVADALRRRCGSFCSPDDVVIFRAQEQLKRASEATLNANMSRTLLGESLKLFQKVAGSLTLANLEIAVDQYIQRKYFAGAIQLCLDVAHEKDRGNTALSWINDNRPANDKRQEAFEDRAHCYELIHGVLQSLDEAVRREPEIIDGKRTLMGTKRDEAYDVVNNSADEVFHAGLYDWYVRQGLADRLLSIESPHVVTFLQRLAASDPAHADLLCRFYTMRNRYFEAATVQSEVAQSQLQISIKQRITLLARAKTNASIMTAGIGRQDLQMLTHQVTELLEVAHIQDDLLERLMADSRIPQERKAEIQANLDGPIRGLSELFNDYADQAGYYDLCLIIFHAADFRNPTTISQTWTHLIEQTQAEVATEWDEYNQARAARGANDPNLEPPPQPYEKLVGIIQEICHRASNDSFIFPVTALLPEVCRYSFEYGQDGRINADVTWPVQLFLQLDVSYDLVMRVLEQMFEQQDLPFRGNGRARIVEWIVYVVGQWLRHLGRGGRSERGLEQWVITLLRECETFMTTARGVNEGGLDMPQLAREVHELIRVADGGLNQTSMRNSFGGFV